MNQTTETGKLPPALTQEENLPSLPTVAIEVLRLSRDSQERSSV